MHSPQLSEIRARAEYSPRWLLVPLVPIVFVLTVWFVMAEPGDAQGAATPMFVDSIDTAPAAIESHGA